SRLNSASTSRLFDPSNTIALMSPKLSVGADAAAGGAGFADAAEGAVAPFAGSPPPRGVAAADGTSDVEAKGFGAADGAAAGGDAAAWRGFVWVEAGTGWVAGAGAGSGFAGAGAVSAGASLLAGDVGCVSVDGAGTMIVVGRRSAMNASTPPPMTSASTS